MAGHTGESKPLWTCRLRRFGLLALFGVAGTGAALAQTAKEDSVATRVRPDYDALGIESRDFFPATGTAADPAVGSFILFPKIDLETEYDDNTFRTETDKRADTVFRVKPGIRAESDWDNHVLAFRANGELGRFAENGSEDYNDYNFGVNGRLDLTEEMSVGLGSGFARAHQDRGSPDDTGLGIPLTKFFQTSYDANVVFTGEPLSFRLDGVADVFNFQDAGPINNDDQDRNKYKASFRVGYEILEGTTLFVQPGYNVVRYDAAVDDEGLRRDSQGYEVLAGFTWDLSGVTFLELGAGYLRQSFDDPLLGTVRGPSFSGDLVWNATDLMTLTGRLSRTVKETTLRNASGILETNLEFVVDYDPLENLIFTLSGAFRNQDFKGIDRSEDGVRFWLGMKYLMNPNVVWELRYENEDLDSNLAGESYKNNQWLGRLTFRL